MARLVVAGAGVGGLSAALALARRGCRVTVLERRDAIGEVGAGLQLSPNATRHLAEWGLLDSLRRVATKPESIRIRRGLDGAELSRLRLDRTGGAAAPFLLLHRADLQAALLAALEDYPQIELQLGTDVSGVADEGNGVAVHARAAGDAKLWKAEGFVSAAGLRDRLLPGTPDARFTGRVAWRALVPADALASEFLRSDSNLWLGPRAHLVHYPLRGASMVNIVAIVEDTGAMVTTGDFWSEPGDAVAVSKAFEGWHPTPRSLIASASTWRKWPLLDRPPGTRWSRGRRTVLGDAAHPMLPFLAQGASQAVEDAAALADAVAACPNDIATAFGRYEAARRPRAEYVQRASRAQGRVYHLSGPASLARDAVMKMMGSQAMLRRMNWLYEPA